MFFRQRQRRQSGLLRRLCGQSKCWLITQHKLHIVMFIWITFNFSQKPSNHKWQFHQAALLCAPLTIVLIRSTLLCYFTCDEPNLSFPDFLSFSFSFCLCLRAALQFRAVCRQSRQGKIIVIWFSILTYCVYILFSDGGLVRGAWSESSLRSKLSPS